MTESSSITEWIPLLESTKLSQMSIRGIVTALPDEPLSVVLEKLTSNRILAAIVVDPRTERSIGFIDALDILTELLIETNINTKTFTQEQMEFLLHQGERFVKQSCGDLVNMSQRDPLIFINVNSNLLDAAKILQDCHRAVVVNENNEIFNIISQLDLVSFLLARFNFLRRETIPMQQDGLIPGDVVGSLDEDTNVMGAMRYMRDCGVSGIAITNKAGQLITNFSATDLLDLTPDKFQLLTLGVKEFLLQVHGYLRAPVCCKANDSIDILMLKMDFFRVHRVYIVDEEMKPIGFISLTDIMRFLVGDK